MQFVITHLHISTTLHVPSASLHVREPGPPSTIHTVSCTCGYVTYTLSSLTIHNILGLFYYTLGNLPPYLRSPTNSIQLVTVVKTKYVEKYGIDTVMEPFL